MVDEHFRSGVAPGDDAPREDSIAKLLRLAGLRAAVPPAVRARVHAAVQQEWRRSVAARRRRRWAVPASLAAAVVLAVMLGGRLALVDPEPVATVTLVAGAGVQPHGLVAGDPLYPGDSITTGDNGVSLAFDNGLSLRLAARTIAVVEARDEVRVTTGTVYADSGLTARADRRITVHTDIGSATDFGTQFAVGYDSGVMSVAVREGSVRIDARRAEYTADAGEKLTFRKGEEAQYTKLPPHDSSWRWAAALAPPFDIDRRPVIDFLHWVTRETGKDLVFATDGARLAAMATRLNGSVAGLTPSEAIEAVRPTIPRFRFRVDEQRVIVRLAQ
jgi:FecR protein